MSVSHKRMGSHGVLVSNLCLGTMNFGWMTSEKDSFAIMDKALELGINFFDTADVYGRWSTHSGHSEEIIGTWCAQGGGCRVAVILATKVYNPAEVEGDIPEPNHNDRNLSAVKIKKHCDNSLRRLQTDYIDLYQMHHVDRQCPWAETWQAYDSLITQGKVIYAGSSNFAGWDIATANQEAARRGMTGLVSEQSVYNLNNRMVELEVLPAAEHYGLGVIPWSPLSGGLLGGALAKADAGRRSGERFQKEVEKNRSKLEAFEKLCADLGESPATIALAWLLHNPIVTAPIIGPRNMEQLESAVHAASVQLDEATMTRLDEIFPGPGGQAPKAYAW